MYISLFILRKQNLSPNVCIKIEFEYDKPEDDTEEKHDKLDTLGARTSGNNSVQLDKDTMGDANALDKDKASDGVNYPFGAVRGTEVVSQSNQTPVPPDPLQLAEE